MGLRCAVCVWISLTICNHNNRPPSLFFFLGFVWHCHRGLGSLLWGIYFNYTAANAINTTHTHTHSIWGRNEKTIEKNTTDTHIDNSTKTCRLESLRQLSVSKKGRRGDALFAHHTTPVLITQQTKSNSPFSFLLYQKPGSKKFFPIRPIIIIQHINNRNHFFESFFYYFFIFKFRARIKWNNQME